MVSKHTLPGTSRQNWHIAKGSPKKEHDESTSNTLSHGPIGSPVESEIKPISTKSKTSSAKTIFEPMLSSRKDSISNEGYPKTEYVWRHPPVFETADGRTTPARHIAASSRQPYRRSIDEEEAQEYGAGKTEEELVFKNSGYGTENLLPGLAVRNPAATDSGVDSITSKKIAMVEKDECRTRRHDYNIPRTDEEGQATKGLRRIQAKVQNANSSIERRRKSGNAAERVQISNES
jgi:hypothetical protein